MGMILLGGGSGREVGTGLGGFEEARAAGKRKMRPKNEIRYRLKASPMSISIRENIRRFRFNA